MAGMMGPRRNFGEKDKMDLNALKKIVRYAKPYYLAVAISLLFAVCSSIATIVGPDKISELTNLIKDGMLFGIDFDAFLKVCFTVLGLYVLGAVCAYSQQFIMATVTQKMSRRLRDDINTKINRLPLSYFDKTTKGDILSRVTNDVDTIAQTLGSATANLLSSIVLFFGVIFMMFKSNWLLALVTIGTSVIGFALMSLILAKSQKYFNSRQVFIGELNGQIEEVYINYKVVTSYGAVNNEKERFHQHNENIYKVEWISQFLSGLMHPIMHFVGSLSNVLIFVVGVAVIVNGGSAVSIGTLISFVIYARLFSQPLQTFAQSMTSIQQASASSRRVFEMLDAEEMADESHKTMELDERTVKGDVEFRNVKFGYDADDVIIKDFSGKFSAGQKVAIVGPTGAGKTTLVNLLMRFYEVDSGDILIDGVSLKDLTRTNVHDLFDMILQDTWLFSGTIRENLVYNKKQVSDESLDIVCEAVGLKHFIATLPNKYDTMLDENTSLSEGQKQQLTIARAMIKNSPLLILDEATSNVDTRTELIIQEAMDKLCEGRTSFVIAHRLSTIKNADVILVLKDGDVVEQGTHDELLNLNGAYAELYNSQFMDEKAE